MTRDELNQALLEDDPVLNEKLTMYKLEKVRHLTDVTLVYYRKIKGNKLGRLRVADLVSFTKKHHLC